MSTEREQLHERLVAFYKRHDPARLDHGIDAVVDYGLAQGMNALNSALMDRYGAYLGSVGDQAFGDVDRQMLRSRIEMFYIKHEASKLDSPSDIDAITEWTLINGLDALSDKLARKFGEGVEDVQESDVLVQLEAFYDKHDPSKSEADVRTVLTWGIVHGFTTLNLKMIAKYGEGLGAMDRAKVRAQIEEKLTRFYQSNAPERLEPQNLEFIVDLTLKHGLFEMNRRLQQKYGCNMSTMGRKSLQGSMRPQAGQRRSSRTASVRRSLRKSLEGAKARVSKPAPPAKGKRSDDPELAAAEEAVAADMAYQEYLRKLIEVFYARHDANRLLEEGVTPIITYALQEGEGKLNERLRKRYGQDLVDIDKEFQHVRERLIRFYSRFDPGKLEPESEDQLDTVAGWAVVNGIDKLNATLLRKYDDDLDDSGLKARLRLFYAQVEKEGSPPKTDAEIQEIVDWCYSHSVAELNRRLHKRYGKSLLDTTFSETPEAEMPVRAGVKPGAPPPPKGLPPGHKPNFAFKPPPPRNVRKYKNKDVPLPPTEPPGSQAHDDDDGAAALPEEGDRAAGREPLKAKLMTFYSKKDPSKANDKQVEADVDTIMQDGIEAFNAELVRAYGESLVSVEKTRRKTLTRKSADKLKPDDKV